jgi:CTP:molybdopterin cytidylyltransferase MocA
MVIALLLAAGESKRTRPLMKQLYPVCGTTLVDFVVKKIFAGGAKKVRVVLGCESEAVRRSIREDVDIVINSNYVEGMLSSIKCGLVEEDAYLIFPVDYPLVRPDTIRRIIDSDRDDEVIVPVIAGNRGHPVLMPESMFAELKRFEGVSLRDFIHSKRVREVSVEDEGIVMNFNTPEQLQKLNKLISD